MRWQAIHTIQLNGEAGSADMAGVTFARETLGPLLAHFEQADGSHINHSLDNILTTDETGLFWKQQPHRTLAVANRAGTRPEMRRTTLALTACNASGARDVAAATLTSPPAASLPSP